MSVVAAIAGAISRTIRIANNANRDVTSRVIIVIQHLTEYLRNDSLDQVIIPVRKFWKER